MSVVWKDGDQWHIRDLIAALGQRAEQQRFSKDLLALRDIGKTIGDLPPHLGTQVLLAAMERRAEIHSEKDQ